MDEIRQSFMRWKVSVALTFALALVAMTLPGCQASTIPVVSSAKPTPTLPAGWTWYRDTQFPFAAPVPPGWQAHGFWNWTDPSDKHCEREVDLVPPVSQLGYTHDPNRLFEEVTIVVKNSCGDFVPARDNRNLSPSGQVRIGDTSGTLYTQIDEAGDQRVAIARLGGHQYVLTLTYEFGDATPSAGDQAQVAIFNTVLKDFTYFGK